MTPTTPASKGIFLVIEGTDGAGKSTQYDLLRQRLKDEGHDVEEIHFPRYDEPSSYFVREYLKGTYGTAEQVGPYTASLFFALDRYQAIGQIRQALDAGKVVLCDRFTGSNMAHQGTKFAHPEERRGYFLWLDNLEFEVLGIPRPDFTFVLTAPYQTILERLDTRTDSSTHVSGKDIHEANPEHIRRSLEVFIDLCSLFPKDFRRIDALRGNEPLDPQAINDLIWQTAEPMLPKVDTSQKVMSTTAPTPEVTTPANPYVEKTDTGWHITPAGQQFLQEAVTDTTGNVYGFSDKLSAMTIAAAMARLSRRGDDMRITLLDEFAGHEGKDEGLLHRVITAYGDDSVQQLVGQYIVVENADQAIRMGPPSRLPGAVHALHLL